MAKLKIKKGDKVVVLTGRDKGRIGEVIQVMPKEDRALVRGINLVKRHQRQTQTSEGGIISKEAAIQLSNIAVADANGKPWKHFSRLQIRSETIAPPYSALFPNMQRI